MTNLSDWFKVFMISGIILALGFLALLFHFLFEFLLDFPENLSQKPE